MSLSRLFGRKLKPTCHPCHLPSTMDPVLPATARCWYLSLPDCTSLLKFVVLRLWSLYKPIPIERETKLNSGQYWKLHPVKGRREINGYRSKPKCQALLVEAVLEACSGAADPTIHHMEVHLDSTAQPWLTRSRQDSTLTLRSQLSPSNGYMHY